MTPMANVSKLRNYLYGLRDEVQIFLLFCAIGLDKQEILCGAFSYENAPL